MENYLLLGLWVLSLLFVTGMQIDNVTLPVPKNPIMFICFVIGAIIGWPIVMGVVTYNVWRDINKEEERIKNESANIHEQERERGESDSVEPRDTTFH